MNYQVPVASASSTMFPFSRKTENTPFNLSSIRILKPEQVYLVGKINANFEITQPFQINIEYDGSGYVVSDDIFLVYGDGDTQAAAMKDYISSLIEFYQMVEKDAVSNPFDKKLLNHLRTYIQPLSARGRNAVQVDAN